MLQEGVLFSRSVAEHIRYGPPSTTDAEIADAAALTHADEFIAGIPGTTRAEVGDRGAQLSGG